MLDDEPLLEDDRAGRALDETRICSPEDPEPPPLGDAAHEKGGNVAWGMMMFVMLGDMFGLGCLTLPANFAQLGWVVALALIALCALGMLYSGRLFTLLGILLPKARTFDDFGTMSLGNTGRRLSYVFVYGTILLSPIMLQLTSAESLQQILYAHNIDRWTAGLIVAVLMVPLALIQGLEDVAGLSLFGSLGMLLAVVVALAKLVTMGEPQPTEIFHQPTSFTKPVVAILDIIFSYGGQQNWARFLTQMRVRRHFSRTVGSVAFIMSCIYIVTGAIGYVCLGKTFESGKPLTSVLPVDAVWTPIMNAGLFVHCILAYQINMNVWCDLVLHLVGRPLSWPASKVRKPGVVIWGVVSVVGIASSFVVAALLPFFSTVAAVMAALGDIAGAYALPACFVLAVAGSKLSRCERTFLKVLVPVTFGLSGIGLAVSVYSLGLEVRHHLN